VPRSTFRTTLSALTESFVDDVMDAIRSASLEDVARGRTRPPPRVRHRIVAASGADMVTPEPADEITDPDMLLGLGMPPPLVDLSPGPIPADPTTGLHMKLRENETLARVSGAGVVIRRAGR
jgi:hypothetical protein